MSRTCAIISAEFCRNWGTTWSASLRTARELVELCREQLPDLVITDLRMPDMDGDQAMRVIWSERPTPCIFISAYSKPAPSGNGSDGSGCVFLTKPVSRDELEGAIEQVTSPHPDGESKVARMATQLQQSQSLAAARRRR